MFVSPMWTQMVLWAILPMIAYACIPPLRSACQSFCLYWVQNTIETLPQRSIMISSRKFLKDSSSLSKWRDYISRKARLEIDEVNI